MNRKKQDNVIRHLILTVVSDQYLIDVDFTEDELRRIVNTPNDTIDFLQARYSATHP